MHSTNSLSQMRLASRLCIIGAWATLALGIILIILFYVLNNVNDGQGGGPGIGVMLFVALIIAMLAFFFFLVLYALGALLNYVSAPQNIKAEGSTPSRMKDMPEEDDTQLEITPIQRMW